MLDRYIPYTGIYIYRTYLIQGTPEEIPSPTFSIYATENGEKVGEPVWTGTVPLLGVQVQLEPNTMYIIDESGYEIDGFVCLDPAKDYEIRTGDVGSLTSITIYPF